MARTARRRPSPGGLHAGLLHDIRDTVIMIAETVVPGPRGSRVEDESHQPLVAFLTAVPGSSCTLTVDRIRDMTAGAPRAVGHGIAVLLAFLAAACANRPETAPPVQSGEPVEAKVHVVERGDTLYGIAWRHGVDYREIAAANGIGPPYLIRPGQRLELPAPGRASTAEHPNNAASREEVPRPAPERPEATESPVAPFRAERDGRDPDVAEPPRRYDPVGTSAPGRGHWPVPDEPVRGFDAESKFVVYQPEDGAAVWSATGGVVVYAGPGLGGYAHLVIVKADDRHLLAYAVNVPPTVAEGAVVRPGDLIARLAGGRDARRFRFEVRDRGKPVDPARLIRTDPAR